MPINDGTGPLGQGPMTGRGLGSCFGNLPRPRGRYHLGRGRGFCFNNGNWANQLSRLEQLALLKEEEKDIATAIADLEKEG
ncbi:MAG: DUF5320 domain-containing protein [Candidatus Paceibacterota bacterium]